MSNFMNPNETRSWINSWYEYKNQKIAAKRIHDASIVQRENYKSMVFSKRYSFETLRKYLESIVMLESAS